MASRTYQHSTTFANLKDIKEEIPGSLTTYQWLSTLDYFLESAIDPIATAWPDFLDNYFSKVVAWQFYKPAVKFSRNSREMLPHLLFNSLTTEGATKRRWQKEMLLNRGLLFGLVAMFLRTTESFMALHDPSKRLTPQRRLAIQQAERHTSPFLHSCILQVRYWDAKARWFKDLLTQKYIRMALMSAKRTYTDVDYAKELDDIVQTFLVYMSKAIDRCDSRQGVLTTFIQTWFYSARSEVRRQVATDVHTSYEELLENGGIPDSTEPDTTYEAIQHLAATAKGLDPVGSLRYALGIPEFHTTADRQALLRFAVPKP